MIERNKEPKQYFRVLFDYDPTNDERHEVHQLRCRDILSLESQDLYADDNNFWPKACLLNLTEEYCASQPLVKEIPPIREQKVYCFLTKREN